MSFAVLQGVLLPFLGTTCVLFMKKSLNPMVQRGLTGFAAGVMVAASVWSLLIPAMEQSEEMGAWSFVPAVVGFWLGILFLLLLDKAVPHLHQGSTEPEGPKAALKKTTMLVLAVTLHNIPEGLAVGVVYAGWLSGNETITLTGAIALALGIALQNFPEGTIISMPLRAEGMKKGEAFLWGDTVRSCGTAGSTAHYLGSPLDCSGVAVSTELCCGSHDLCGGRGADTGDVSGKAFQSGYGLF